MLGDRRPADAAPAWAASAGRDLRLEVIPLEGIADGLAERLPPDTTVTVTASPRRGEGPTVELATHLARQGVRAVPHLSARLIADEAELAGIVRDLSAAGVREVFVIGGDAEEPAGDFASALDLLVALERIGHAFTIGIAGYPETHPKFPDDVAVAALHDKQAYASYIVSQMCFDPPVLLEWVRAVRDRGVQLPIRIGVAGPASTGRLLRTAAKVGVGESMRVLAKQRGGMRHLAGPGNWRPDDLLDELAPAFADPSCGLQGLHVYTFNAVADTVAWWQEATGEGVRSRAPERP